MTGMGGVMGAKFSRICAVWLATACLASCQGGGGSGKSSAAPLTSAGNWGAFSSGSGAFWNTAAQGTAYAGTAQTASLTVPTGALTIDSAGVFSTATITPSQSTLALSGANTGTNSVTMNEVTGAQTLYGVSVYQTSGKTSDGSPISLYTFGPAAVLSYSDFGMWAISNSSGSSVTKIGLYALGTPTPATTVPVVGSATYTGGAVGAFSNATNLYYFTGTTQLNVNFGSAVGAIPTVLAQVSGSISNINAYLPGATTSSGTLGTWSMTPLNVAATNITGNTFSGVIAPVSAGSISLGAAGSGAFNGTFFGPGASEAGGAFYITGSGGQVVGSFGTHR